MYGVLWNGYNRLAGPAQPGPSPPGPPIQPPFLHPPAHSKSRRNLRRLDIRIQTSSLEDPPSNRVTFLIDLEVKDGKHDEFSAAVDNLVKSTQNETTTLQYCFFRSDDGSKSRVLETHHNVTAAQRHYQLHGKAWLQGLQNVTVQTAFEVLVPSLGGATTSLQGVLPKNSQVFGYWKGFDKLVPHLH